MDTLQAGFKEDYEKAKANGRYEEDTYIYSSRDAFQYAAMSYMGKMCRWNKCEMSEQARKQFAGQMRQDYKAEMKANHGEGDYALLSVLRRVNIFLEKSKTKPEPRSERPKPADGTRPKARKAKAPKAPADQGRGNLYEEDMECRSRPKHKPEDIKPSQHGSLYEEDMAKKRAAQAPSNIQVREPQPNHVDHFQRRPTPSARTYTIT